MPKLSWTGFSKKTPQERIQFIKEHLPIASATSDRLQEQELLSLTTANQMTENVISRMALPFSVVPDVLVDGQHYHLPYVTEEPSVVAAASFAASIIKRSGGFQTSLHNRQMIGQVVLYNVPHMQKAQAAIAVETKALLAIANEAYPSIVKRGGGAKMLTQEEKGDFLIVYVTVDTKEAMGANMVNTMMEALAPRLEELTGAPSLMAILSNYATEALVTATCTLELRFLSRNQQEAVTLADKIARASQLAQVDPYRASTHNKGIFNGIDAIVLATGNDWRAIEAGAHAYAARDRQYRGLATWDYLPNKACLKGSLTLPMPIATKGGSIGLNPSVKTAHDLLGNPDAKTLASIIVAIGLAQNFAALKALVSIGIQAGHMKLQARSLAMLAGAKEAEIPQLVTELLQAKHMNLATAQAILKTLKK
ncbi:hydroxymethylglutaryl-CoA reductase, degradative [Streptococcus halichoeri]|uniref:hydroxymethylglutaryl-CoA reductase, degradative n=1 Tax=Streptococcus halichoeri TaxID=254785 RepID=UPI00135AFC2C|nr:hydroxymethylglutaryl-CoA reductase, degradative [Streptococcus halichoeri]